MCAHDRKAHGRNENEEKSRSGKFTFLPVFSHFPRMQSIRSAVFHTAQPVARSAGSQFAKQQLLFFKGVSAWRRCHSQVAKLQSTFFKRISAWRRCRSQLAKHLLFFCEQVCACCFTAPAHCLQNEDCKSGTGSRGNAPCGVGRGNAPPSFPTLHREIACVIQIDISGTGCRVNDPAGVQG